MKFQTSDNLIDLLVGQSLYANPDVAMRELLQNAEDACFMQTLVDLSHIPMINVRFSVVENWVEVSDNGLGMSTAVFEESFATVGASKGNSPTLDAILSKAGKSSRPIGQFGIGILSCFGVADVVEVRTSADDAQPVSVRIRDRRSEFEVLDDHRRSRGTTIRLLLKADGPMHAKQVEDALARYVRHASHISIENTDTGVHGLVPEQWLLDAWSPSSKVQSEAIDAGHLELSDAWDNISHGLDIQLVMCNAGFLVTNAATGVLAEFATGLRGELNIRPGGLTILMSREGFQHDEDWSAFVDSLTDHYRKLIAEKLNSWINSDLSHAAEERLRAMQRMVLLILKSPLGEIAGTANIGLAKTLIPHVLLMAEFGKLDYNVLLNKARIFPPFYVFRTDEQTQVQRSFSDRGQTLSMTENVRSLELRISLLKLNGFAVARLERHDYSLHIGGRHQSVQIHDALVLADECERLGIAVNRIQDAPAAHTTIGSSEDAEAITRLFEMSSNLKFQSVDSMTDAIIADFNGYILNARNHEIRSILEIMPAAVGNPVRKDLLSAYFALTTYDVSKAREIIFDLITDPEFEVKARGSTGHFFREYLETRVKSLLKVEGYTDA